MMTPCVKVRIGYEKEFPVQACQKWFEADQLIPSREPQLAEPGKAEATVAGDKVFVSINWPCDDYGKPKEELEEDYRELIEDEFRKLQPAAILC